jgi:hypothetical protein
MKAVGAVMIGKPDFPTADAQRLRSGARVSHLDLQRFQSVSFDAHLTHKPGRKKCETLARSGERSEQT